MKNTITGRINLVFLDGQIVDYPLILRLFKCLGSHWILLIIYLVTLLIRLLTLFVVKSIEGFNKALTFINSYSLPKLRY